MWKVRLVPAAARNGLAMHRLLTRLRLLLFDFTQDRLRKQLADATHDQLGRDPRHEKGTVFLECDGLNSEVGFVDVEPPCEALNVGDAGHAGVAVYGRRQRLILQGTHHLIAGVLLRGIAQPRVRIDGVPPGVAGAAPLTLSPGHGGRRASSHRFREATEGRRRS